MTYEEFLIEGAKDRVRQNLEEGKQTHRCVVNYLVACKYLPAIEVYLESLTPEALDERFE